MTRVGPRRLLALPEGRSMKPQRFFLIVTPMLMVAVTALPHAVVGQCTPLTCDTAVNASIDTPSEVDCFTFDASDGQTVEITAVHVGDTPFRAAWRLLDSSGNPVEGPCGEFGPSKPNFSCTLDGTSGGPYRLEVEAVEAGDTGAYAVRFETMTADGACEDIPLSCGVPVYGMTDDPLDTDLFSFSVEDGEWVEISAESGFHGGTVILAAWQLIDGSGKPVTGPCGEFARNGIDYACGPLPASGNPYRIVVGDVDAKYA